MTELPPAGWYDDSETPGGKRYWDGGQWTEQRQAASVGQPAPPPPVPPGMSAAGQASAVTTGPAQAAPQLPSGAPKKRGLGKKILLGLVAVLVVIVAISALSGNKSNTGSTGGSTPAANITTPGVSKSTSAAKTSPTPAAPAAAISGDGTYTVPGDIAPGTYTAEQAQSGCYWQTAKDASGSLDSIIANENAAGPTVVTIPTNAKTFQTNGCGPWVKGTPTFVTSKTSIGEGTWAVGANVAPGTYKAPGGSGCYWARLRNFVGGIDSIIANDNASGQVVVTIAATDKGFQQHGCGTFKKS